MQAKDNASYILEDLYRIYLDLIDLGVDLAKLYQLKHSDITWPQDGQENLMY